MIKYLNTNFNYDEKFVETYDEAPLWSSIFAQLLFENINYEDHISIIDLACGTGFPTFELAQRFGSNCKIYGVDQWKEALKRAEVKKFNYLVDNVQFLECNAENIDLPNDSIDLIVSNLGINNFSNIENCLKEMNRVIKNNGKIIITTNIKGHFKEFYDIFEKTLFEENELNLLNDLKNHIAHRGTIKSISKKFNDFGFKKIKVKKKVIKYNYFNGTSFLNHYFIKAGFLDSWKQLVGKNNLENIFKKLESNLNKYSNKKGKLSLSVPVLYLEFVKNRPVT
ncbi:MAG: hypothetical protein A2086_01490 [Spirochaetes bacterium GWD1_27_9]|nr:MAG: hypothetical protein A2Z98_13110 [Spirochaetes bacterium GWB1_27_13]OHD23180.1 MAG: hypothetical protein A2Y34_15475 [Spirochaetes bacterium GWC1_27_15]OHD42705.1 MAG: hypothetical protein A2086_01490 [Spirochaetes bacterium GWD1_27_9]